MGTELTRSGKRRPPTQREFSAARARRFKEVSEAVPGGEHHAKAALSEGEGAARPGSAAQYQCCTGARAQDPAYTQCCGPVLCVGCMRSVGAAARRRGAGRSGGERRVLDFDIQILSGNYSRYLLPFISMHDIHI
eukprot:6202832-Pleurochrysis_carterae.AAC.1